MTSLARVCSVEGCGKKHLAKGYCNAHYKKSRPPRGECRVDGCLHPVDARGLCNGHFKRAQAGQDMTPLRARGTSYGPECSIPGCSGAHKAKGFCSRHYLVGHTYKLDPREYEDEKGRGCQICGRKDLATLHIDHDHSCCPGDNSCGECTRGLLCAGCNRGLGHFEDDPQRLLGAIQYLQRNGIE